MGAGNITIFDDDGVSDINLPNQFFRRADVRKFKVDALAEIVSEYSECAVTPITARFGEDRGGKVYPLEHLVIVATDSMRSRAFAWTQFKAQDSARVLIEARMGAEQGRVYTIRKGETDPALYDGVLYPDSAVEPVPCTAKAILYNVLMISALIGRSYKAIINGEPIPFEMIFNLTHIEKYSWMIR